MTISQPVIICRPCNNTSAEPIDSREWPVLVGSQVTNCQCVICWWLEAGRPRGVNMVDTITTTELKTYRAPLWTLHCICGFVFRKSPQHSSSFWKGLSKHSNHLLHAGARWRKEQSLRKSERWFKIKSGNESVSCLLLNSNSWMNSLYVPHLFICCS